MKRKTILILCLVFSGLSGISQRGVTLNTCPEQDQVRKVVKAADNMVRFVKQVKESAGADSWNNFITDAESGDVLNGFKRFGADSITYKAVFVQIANEFGSELITLATLIDPASSMRSSQLTDNINEKIRCFLSDTIENDLSALLTSTGRTAGPEIGAGPCEREARTCMDNAENAYLQNLMGCGGVGAGIGAISTGWWGWGSGAVCFILASNRHNNAVWSCVNNYFDCTHPRTNN